MGLAALARQRVSPAALGSKAAGQRDTRREGSFSGVLTKRAFRVVLVGKGHGAEIGESAAQAQNVIYKGERLVVKPKVRFCRAGASRDRMMLQKRVRLIGWSVSTLPFETTEKTA